ncbi:MAG: hypothetical protein M3487_08480, partial [Actinomycetota bacterium]|nr:hypothetical protein [Actinomycetota bacterium]
ARTALSATAGALLAYATLRIAGLDDTVTGAGRAALVQCVVAAAAVTAGFLAVLALLRAPELDILRTAAEGIRRGRRRSAQR